jgi:dTDP-L-rhamnose 4-epimerase
MKKKVLVTGGAGFIGSFIVDELVGRGYPVRILDNLEPQVHGADGRMPAYLNRDAEFVKADVRDTGSVRRALRGVEVVFHHAALVGVGQSMYQIRRYTEINAVGAAAILDVIASGKNSVKKMIVASSMSIYGEGAYNCGNCGVVYPQLRSSKQLRASRWEMECPRCGGTAHPIPTDENKPLYPTSIYAINKRDHEEMFMAVGIAYKIPTVALRYFNVYGPRQALSNPYTGVCAIFSARLLNGRAPVIYEDGLQSRDFVHVTDVVQANMLAMEKSEADYNVFNVGSGRSVTILDVARVLGSKIAAGSEMQPEIIGRFREGDIRHCYADISRIRKCLGYAPRVRFENGIEDLTKWVKQQVAEDRFEQARQELEQRGLTL